MTVPAALSRYLTADLGGAWTAATPMARTPPPRPDPLLGQLPAPGMGPPWCGTYTVRAPSTLVADIWAAHDRQQAQVVEPTGDDDEDVLVVPFIVPGEE